MYGRFASFAFLLVVAIPHVWPKSVHRQGILEKNEAPSLDSAAGATSPITLPIYIAGIYDEWYEVDIGFGTPVQTLSLSLNNHYGQTLLIGTNATHAPNCKGPYPSRNYFNYGASTTWQPLFSSPMSGDLFTTDEIYVDPYCDHGVVDGLSNPGNENIQIGSLNFQTYLNVIDDVQTGALNPHWPSGGVLGLGVDNQAWFWKLLAKPQMTLYFNNSVDAKQKQRQLAGSMTLGGKDAVNCDSQWTYFPQAEPSDILSVNVLSLTIGANTFYVTQTDGQVTPSLESAFSLVGETVLENIVAATNAEYDWDTDRYTLDCASRTTLPDIAFNMQGMTYSVPAMDYARRLSWEDDKCTLMFLFDEEKSGSTPLDITTIGNIFYRPHCFFFDYDTGKMAYAKALH